MERNKSITYKVIGGAMVAFFGVIMILPAWGAPLAKATLDTRQAESASDGAGHRRVDTLASELRATQTVLEHPLSQSIASLVRERDLLAPSLEVDDQTLPGDRTQIQKSIEDLNVKIADLTAGQEVFSNLGQPLSPEIYGRARRIASPEPSGFDVAYFLHNPHAWLTIAEQVERDPDYGKVGQSGIVNVLLPYAMREEGVLTGIDAANIPEVFKVLNEFASKHTGKNVNVKPEQFLIVPSEKLANIHEVNRFVQERTGKPLARIFARREVAQAFSAVTSLVAFIFDLPLKDNEIAGGSLEAALLAKIEAGPAFNESMAKKVSQATADALRKMRDTVRRL